MANKGRDGVHQLFEAFSSSNLNKFSLFSIQNKFSVLNPGSKDHTLFTSKSTTYIRLKDLRELSVLGILFHYIANGCA